MPSWLRGVRAAFVFLTRIPVGGFPYTEQDFRWAAAHAPLVGLVIGGIMQLAFVALLPLGALPAAILVLGLQLLLTGAFHEDGLADTSDALGGGYTREKIHLILKDSRVGSFGAAAIGVSLIARTVLIAALAPLHVWVLPLVQAGARVGPIWLMALLPYVTQNEAAKSRDIARGGVLQALVASLWWAALLLPLWVGRYLGAARGLALVIISLLICAVCGFRFMRRLGGLTGDFLGATEQLLEIGLLCALAYNHV